MGWTVSIPGDAVFGNRFITSPQTGEQQSNAMFADGATVLPHALWRKRARSKKFFLTDFW
jgi:hypothetical protein